VTSAEPIENRRILVIDDNVSIHEDFRKILAPPKDASDLGQMRAALFGEALSLPPQVSYGLEFANQGREGLGLVQIARQRGNPYAMAFVDMRMPPGWDGLETIERIRYVDPEIEIVICTAYSDHPWEEIGRRIGNTDKLLILMKPFNSIEVVQMASTLTKKWNLARSVTRQIESLAQGVIQQTAQLREANARLQERIVSKMGEGVSDTSPDEIAETYRQKEEFLAIMSHEICVPMSELVGKVALLLNSTLNSQQWEQMAIIERCAQDVVTLLKDMHEFMAVRKQETQVREA